MKLLRVLLLIMFDLCGFIMASSEERSGKLFCRDFSSFISRKPCRCMKWMHDYQDVDDKKGFIHSSRNTQQSRFIAYSCNIRSSSCSGIGDRIRGIQELAHIAAVTNRAFHIDWTFPTRLEYYFLPNKINWTVPDANIYINSTILNAMNLHSKSDFYRMVFPAALDRKHKSVAVTSNMYFTTEPSSSELHTMGVIVAPDVALKLVKWKGHRQEGTSVNHSWSESASETTPSSSPYCDPRECLFHLLFRPSPQLLQATRIALAELLSVQAVNAFATPYLAVHLRLGGMLGELRRVDRVKTLSGPLASLSDEDLISKTYNCSMVLAARHGIEHIVLVTDNLQLRKSSSEDFPRWQTRNVLITHIQHVTKYFPEGSEQLRDEVINSFVDIMLLAKSAVLVRSLSGFSDIAVQAGRHKYVYAIDECISAR